MSHALILFACALIAAWQLRRVPRVWAFLVLFIALMPKVPLAVVPGNTTPIRIDDVVLALVMIWWSRRLFVVTRTAQRSAPPPSPATLFLLLYWGAALASTLLGMAALTTQPLTGLLHFGRLVEYGLLYYFFYATIAPEELDRFVEVCRTALLTVCGVWVVQHWTHAPALGPSTPWSTLYPAFSASYDFGGYMMLSTILLYALWSGGGSRSALTMVALAAGAIVTLNSESRASLLCLALVVGIDLAVRVRWWAVAAMSAAVVAAPYLIRSKKMLTLVHGVVALVTTFDVGVIRDAFATDPSLALRLRNWRLVVDHWLARPFFGDGLGGYLAYIRQYDMPASPDGWYFRVLADTGVVGLASFAILIAALAWMLVGGVRRAAGAPLQRAIVYGAALAVAATSASALLVDVFVSYKIMGMFWMMMAVGTRALPDPSFPPALPAPPVSA